MTPVEYIHRDISKPALVALYRRADVMMITALRDGMNLVAQEFVLCQSEPGLPSRWRGALLLSELAGSAQVLPGALLVNPWDVDGVVEHLATALELSARERQRRLETMSKRVEDLDSRRWADGFLTRLGRYSRRERRTRRPPTVDAAIQERIGRRFARARARTIVLDYDGTLREFEIHPDLAQPTPEIRALLRSLVAVPNTDVHIVSGRRRRNLEQWFGRLPVHLCAEHGYLARAPGEEWRTLVDLDLSWLRPIERLLRRVAADVPGAHVERKSCSVAWHYRQAEPEYGQWRARELLNDLHQHLQNAPAEILQGHQVVEVRAQGVDKGVYVRSLFPDGKEATHFVLGLGDDRTDHDFLDVLPAGSVAGHVGGLLPSTRSANGRRDDVHLVGPGEVRALSPRAGGRCRLGAAALAERAEEREAPPAPGREGEERERGDDRLRRAEDALGDEEEHAGEGQRARDRAGDRLAVGLAQQVVLVALAEAQPMVRGRSHVQDEGERRADERGVVDVALGVVQLAELAREADREQESEEHLCAGDERAQLLEQLVELALEPLLELLGAPLPAGAARSAGSVMRRRRRDA